MRGIWAFCRSGAPRQQGARSGGTSRKPFFWFFYGARGRNRSKPLCIRGVFWAQRCKGEGGGLPRTHKSEKYLPFAKKTGPGKRTGSWRIVQCAQVREKIGDLAPARGGKLENPLRKSRAPRAPATRQSSRWGRARPAPAGPRDSAGTPAESARGPAEAGGTRGCVGGRKRPGAGFRAGNRRNAGFASAGEPRRAQRGAAASPDADLRRATQRRRPERTKPAERTNRLDFIKRKRKAISGK